MEPRLNIRSLQRRILFENVVHRVPLGKKLENRLQGDSGTAKYGLPIANLRVDRDPIFHGRRLAPNNEAAKRILPPNLPTSRSFLIRRRWRVEFSSSRVE